MNDIPKLSDAIPYFTQDMGIFEYFINPPWEMAYPTNRNADILNTAYLGNHSGEKYAAPLVKRYWQANNNAALKTAQLAKLADIISVRYYNVWEHLWKAYVTEYNPAYNYDMLESETKNLSSSNSTSANQTGTETVTRTGDIETGVSGAMQEVIQHEGPVTTNHGGTQSNSGLDNVFGFNSTSEVPAFSNTGTLTNNLIDTVVDTSKQTVTSTPQEYKETQSFKDAKQERTPDLHSTSTGSSSESGTVERTRRGRFGLSLADELAKEFALWSDDFFERVFQDVDKVLTLAVY